MNKELPNVFANPLDKKINNTQEIFYSQNNNIDRGTDITTVLSKINKIFNSPTHVYKSKVRITTQQGVVEKTIVGKTNGSLLTMDGENIKIIDIINIEKI